MGIDTVEQAQRTPRKGKGTPVELVAEIDSPEPAEVKRPGGRKWTDDEKAAHSERMKLALSNPAVRQKLSGRPMSDEQKQKIREALKQHYSDPANREKLQGKTHSDETKQKLRRTMLLKHYAEEDVEAMLARKEDTVDTAA